MKLSSKGRYAVMALADIARFEPENPIPLRDISLRQGISLVYLEQLFLKLKKNKIVLSVRGKNGGYVLNKSAKDIKISEVFLAVEEKVKTIGCENIQEKDVMEKVLNVLLTICGMNLKIILMTFLKEKH